MAVEGDSVESPATKRQKLETTVEKSASGEAVVGSTDKKIGDTVMSNPADDASEATGTNEKTVAPPVCIACPRVDSTPADPVITCVKCTGTVHWRCYHDASATDDVNMREESWTCELCQAPTDEPVTCVYCHQPGDQLLCRVDTSHWKPSLQSSSPSSFAHVLCIQWDPFSVNDEQCRVDSWDLDRLELPVPPCCFCHSDQGVRIQCRKDACGRFFHAKCASAPQCGYLEIQRDGFPLRHAYCDRHHQTREDVNDLVTKITTKSIANLLPRDAATKLLAITRRQRNYDTLDAFLVEIVSLLVDVCKKDLKTSKSDPPVYNTRRLQVLQLVLDHIPQFRRIYDPVTLSKQASDLIEDADLRHVLQKTFNPSRFVRKYAGPIKPSDRCHVCHEPFQERQHIFYCTGTDGQHAQHWKCTKRRSNAKDRSSAGAKKTKKTVPMLQQGMWKDVKVPKGLPSISDEVACGLCRAPIDARAVIAGRKEASRLEFERPPSAFAYGGCYVNMMDAKSAAAAGLRTNRTTVAVATKANGSSKSASKSSKRGEVESAPVLAPPKMERINVRRTTRWIACLGQVIKLVVKAQREGKVAESQVPTEHTETPADDLKAETPAKDKATEVDAVEPATPADTTVVEIPPATPLPDAETPEPSENLDENEGSSASAPPQPSRLPALALAYLEEAKKVVRPFDAYALSEMESAHQMMEQRNGPGLSVLRNLIDEYTRFVYIKHTRAVEKATNEKRKRQEMEAQAAREQERKRIDREAEMALKKQMLAMRKKQRLAKAASST
ncbi:hypothetical protein Poli38472_005495 [Pythium oligandrum]|uniref:PHD-type domain-containing protein n=1 Tax=Pythium oligandrum TaxID=41045 RepID=A0A8K1CIP5_PYTOL|nr:hypothetical protein Poli38472_005495 [Pythium oligandrum]|eukprot:TMW62877.1 hypothetical protein Poli38472_005495 [Pythium oligandrum]